MASNLTPASILIRLKHQKEEAIKNFRNTSFVTIYEDKKDPFSVLVDINFPVYVIKSGKIHLEKNGIKGIRIKYTTDYPEQRPTTTSPVVIASVHCWSFKKICCYTNYNPDTHTLTKEIEHIINVCSNNPKYINYHSMTDQSLHEITDIVNFKIPKLMKIEEWTKLGIAKGFLPTIKYDPSTEKTPVRRKMSKT